MGLQVIILVVGFGISKPDMVNRVSNLSDGAVVGSYLTDCMNKNVGNESSDEIVMYEEVLNLHSGSIQGTGATNQATKFSQVPLHVEQENVTKSMHVRYRWRKAINFVKQAFMIEKVSTVMDDKKIMSAGDNDDNKEEEEVEEQY